MIGLIFFAPLLLCWGSFLNVLGFRLVHEEHYNAYLPFSPSSCPYCKTHIAWYDLIPVLSFFILNKKCRACNHPISWLYPLIEILTLISLSLLWITTSTPYLMSYILFFSALLITTRSDLETMLISPWVTLFMIPIGIGFSFLGWLPISWLESILGALAGYGILYTVSKMFYLITKKEGMGAGDFDLLAYIGSFTGLIGVWFTLLCSSIIGTIFGILYLVLTKKDRSVPIPFGPFLALGAMIYVLLQPMIVTLFLHFTQ